MATCGKLGESIEEEILNWFDKKGILNGNP